MNGYYHAIWSPLFICMISILVMIQWFLPLNAYRKLAGSKNRRKNYVSMFDLTETDYLQKEGPSVAWSSVTDSHNTRDSHESQTTHYNKDMVLLVNSIWIYNPVHGMNRFVQLRILEKQTNIARLFNVSPSEVKEVTRSLERCCTISS